MNVDLLSPLPRTECQRLLREHVASEWSLVTDKAVVGSVDGDNFRIRKKIYYRNSFQRHLFGQLSDAPGGGTRIHGETRELDFKWVFLFAGLVVFVALIAVGVVLYRFRAELHDVPLIAIVGPVLLIPILAGIMIGAVALGRYLGRAEEKFLVDFLALTLQAR